MLDIRLRLWVVKLLVTVLILVLVVGHIKVIRSIEKKSTRNRAIIGTLAAILLTSPVWGILGLLFYTKTESVVTRDGVKYVAVREDFDNTFIDYYEYRNVLFSDGTLRMHENRVGSATSGTVTFYDENGEELNWQNRNYSAYFFPGLGNEYKFQVKELTGSDLQSVTVRATELAEYGDSILFSIDILDDVPEGKSHIATLLMGGEVYLLPDNDGTTIPTKEECKEQGVNIKWWSQTPEEVEGFDITMKKDSDGDYSIWNMSEPLTENGYKATLTWTLDKGLTSFRASNEDSSDVVWIKR